MRTFSILTLGCKVNQYESAQIRQFLENQGLIWIKPENLMRGQDARDTQKPDLFVINTCCVTSTASAKSRQFIQRAKRLNDKAKLVVCGCLTAQQTAELHPKTDGSIHLIANRAELASKIKEITDLAGPSALPLLTAFKEQTRAFLCVQDGCDGVCSYCIIPKVRPVVQSKPIFEAINEAKALVSAGHKEIVVTGVNLGAYGRETTRGNPQIFNFQFSIFDLLEELAKIEGLKRLRVSSLEPGDINGRLLDVFCGHKNIMPHIHLSVQSGSDAILRWMCRQYSMEELREKIALIKSRLDRPALTCDVIVGFPGETEKDFEDTVELARWAGFSKMHIFPFSPRAGTAAAKMKDRLQPKVVKERAEILRQVGNELGYKFRGQFVGESCEVLVEGTNPISGHSERYFTVQMKTNGEQLEKNSIVKAKIVKNADNYVFGVIENYTTVR